jgi:polyphosphate kinase
MKEAREPALVNRELSWLEFNQRVLDEAQDPSVPLLERLNFLLITASNLDEFFMVRVGGLELLVEGGVSTPDPAGQSPATQLALVEARTHRFMSQQYACFDALAAELAEAGIVRLRPAQLDDAQRRYVGALFETEIFPVVTPVAVGSERALPLLANLGLYAAVRLAPAEGTTAPRFALIPLGRGLPRMVALHSSHRHAYILIEDVLALFADRLFPGQKVDEVSTFRITRNAAMSLEDEFAADLMTEMETILAARRTGDCVRLELAGTASDAVRGFLVDSLGPRAEAVYAVPGPVDLTACRPLLSVAGAERLSYPAWPPQAAPALDLTRGLFGQIAKHDILLHHPYDSFDPVVRLIEEAAADPDVLAIKQVLYRTTPDSPIMAALRSAAIRGKYVTALVELKARFDEARNIQWARALEEAGVQVVYGVKGLKTHAKVCLIVRREPAGIVRYCHFGTGNYNERTARLYADVSLMTRDPDLGADASAFFHAITGYSEPRRYRKLIQAPTDVRDRLVELIRGEAERQRQGQEGRILAKMNALVDPKIIEELYAASRAGVEIRLSVRGTCCLRPGVPGLSEHISVCSVIDRYLEHARIFYFHQGGEPRVFISSADWMPRNLSRRVELMVPIDDPACRRRLVGILETSLADTVKGRRIRADGGFDPPLHTGRPKKGLRSQQAFFEQACDSAEEARQTRATFEPHTPPPRREPER